MLFYASSGIKKGKEGPGEFNKSLPILFLILSHMALLAFFITTE
jgi:hypothetical protein